MITTSVIEYVDFVQLLFSGTPNNSEKNNKRISTGLITVRTTIKGLVQGKWSENIRKENIAHSRLSYTEM